MGIEVSVGAGLGIRVGTPGVGVWLATTFVPASVGAVGCPVVVGPLVAAI